jgi:hypothetical protein
MTKLYLAILNHGWLRQEMAFAIIPTILKTADVEVTWENPTLSWGHPIDSNRNAITRRFLATDCDFLLMIDDDVVPRHNPAQLVYANRDVIGCPALVRQHGRCLNWSAYEPGAGGEGYMAVDLRRASSDGDLAPVAIVGTGCILIKRRVLEAIPAPFTITRDEHGVTEMGTDFAFCQRAQAAGFEIWTTPHLRCEHFKEVGLADMTGYDRMDTIGTDNAKYKIPWGGYAIQSIDWDFIKPIVTNAEINTVLEFGAGLSSLLMSEHVSVTSYETDGAVISKIQHLINGNALAIGHWDGRVLPCLLTQQYDLAFIDGPAGGENREAAFRLAAQHAERIVVHDAGRPYERNFQRDILRQDFDLIATNGAHAQHCAFWIHKSV